VPAINLSRLRLQTYELAGLLEEPAAFQTALRALLDEHSHRLLRRGRSLAKRGALPAWDVPGILIREVEAALLPVAREKHSAVLVAAATIWPSGKLEEKQLAAFLAGCSRDPDGLRILLLEWLKETEDPSILQDLAIQVCPPLRTANTLLFRSDLRAWLEARHAPLRRFGWMALRIWVDEKNSEAIFAAFDLLPAVFPETDPETMRLASAVLSRLAEISPRETQGWLAELTPKTLRQSRKLLRMLLPRLSAEMAAFVRGILQAD
jgi:hypothetical protein